MSKKLVFVKPANKMRLRANKPPPINPFGGNSGGVLTIPMNVAVAHSSDPSRQLIALGYLPELPDRRDLLVKNIDASGSALHAVLSEKRNSHLLSAGNKESFPAIVNLREEGHFTGIENQGSLGSCTANAVLGLVEYLLKKHTKETIELSRLFLYKATRNLMGEYGDSGAHLRTTIKALRMFGCLPENWWPYIIDDFDLEPDAFTYTMAQNFKAVEYLRLDDPGESGPKVLLDIKRCLADGFPAAFGFSVFSSIGEMSGTDFTIPFPSVTDRHEGGHAVLAVGYDDERKALLIRNSWGIEWGDSGYGWLPYAYVEHGLARDFWTVLDSTWVNSADFR